MRGRYFGPEGRAIHARLWNSKSAKTPLLCLPPAPHTGLYFQTLANHLDLPTIGVDYPGAGSSDPLQTVPSIHQYAAAMRSVINAFDVVHILGFHTGCLVALEMITQFGPKIGEVILVDGPFFDEKTRAKYAPSFPKDAPPRGPEDLSGSFESTVSKRRDNIGEARALELWVESLRAGPRYNDPFQAAFAFDGEKALRECHNPVHVFATQSSLLEVTRNGAAQLSNARYQEIFEIKSDVFETGAPIIAPMIETILS